MRKENRLLLKLSGEALSEGVASGYNDSTCNRVASEIKSLVEKGKEVGIVIGGGNYWRGRTSEGMDRSKADAIGMLATCMNCLFMADILRQHGLKAHIMTPFVCGGFTELYSKDKAEEYLSSGHIIFFAGGTGHPYFSTDTATILRAVEIEADLVLLAKSIDGIYDSDPAKNPNAKKYDRISIDEVISQKLQALDLTASIMAMENKMPLYVFDLTEKGSIIKAAIEKNCGTVITV